MFGPAVALPLARTATRQAALRRDNEAAGIGVQRLCDLLFVDVRAVRVGSVDKLQAQLERAAQHAQRILAIGRPSPNARAAEAHSAES